MIDKIEFQPLNQKFHITFSPSTVPTDVQSFKSAVMKFAEKFASRIDSVTIGHSKWLDNGDFKLSNLFCEGLVKSLPNLIKLELYNVAL